MAQIDIELAKLKETKAKNLSLEELVDLISAFPFVSRLNYDDWKSLEGDTDIAKATALFIKWNNIEDFDFTPAYPPLFKDFDEISKVEVKTVETKSELFTTFDNPYLN